MLRSTMLGVVGMALLACSAGADEVTNWNNTMLGAIRASATPPPVASRTMAMESVAVFEAVNAIEGGYYSYLGTLAPAPGASEDAAVAQAAYTVLSALYPSREPTFHAALDASLSAVPDGAAKTDGISLGNAAANGVLGLRANDNSSLVVPYTPGSNPGEWVPTPPANAPALLPNWPQVTPWVLNSGSQLRSIAPPALDSAAYAQAYQEVKDYGSATGSLRSADQTNIAKFWADGGGTATPPGHWNLIAQSVSAAQGLSQAQNARLFAQINMAEADAAIVSWDNKYAYNLWRPVTAIRNDDGNGATIADPTWAPLLVTPPFPSYTSGHSTFSGAASTILAEFFGTDDVPFTVHAEGGVAPDRTFTSFSAAANEAGQSRIYGGIHFQFDNQAGLAAGRALGILVARTQLQAVPEAGSLALLAGAGLGLAAIGYARRRRA